MDAVREILLATKPKTHISRVYGFEPIHLGSGGFCTVRKAKKTFVAVAVKEHAMGLKTTTALNATRKTIRSLRQEVSILRQLDQSSHRNVVRLYDVYAELFPGRLFKYYLVMEILEGGTLRDRMRDLEGTSLSESEIRNYIHSILTGLKHCHDQNIVHRDLKLENVMLTTNNPDNAVLKLIDFGFAVVTNRQNDLHGFVGTPHYFAPEIVKDLSGCGYSGKPVDMWCVGIILVTLTTLHFPFDGKNIVNTADGIAMVLRSHPYRTEEVDALLAKAITKLYNISFLYEAFKRTSISIEGWQFIRGLLKIDPNSRLTVDDALAHPWIRNGEAIAMNEDVTTMESSMMCFLKEEAPSVHNAGFSSQMLDPTMQYTVPCIGEYSYYSSDIVKKGAGREEYSIYHGFHTANQTDVLLLIYDCSKMTLEQTTPARYEYDLVKRLLRHPNIVRYDKMINEYNSAGEMIKIGIVMEYLHGGELISRIEERTSYNEEETRRVARIILTTIHFMHENKIIHRNIRPENFLFADDGDDATMKLVNFADAVHIKLQPQGILDGWPVEYLAPEIIQNQPYGEPVDMWAFGVVLYILLCGEMPFYHEQPEGLRNMILNSSVPFNMEYWGEISSAAKDLVLHLLDKNPQQRYSAKLALADPWFEMGDEKLKKKPLSRSKQFSDHRSSSMVSKGN